MEKILVSSCLIGQKVRYDSGHKLVTNSIFSQWMAQGRLVSICPEVAGGLGTPRPPAEIVDNRVVSVEGADVTAEFIRGAEAALQLCRKHDIKMAILKAKSPSCGNSEIYDGTFSGRAIPGSGITAKLLQENGVRVFNENEISDAETFLKMEQKSTNLSAS